MPSTETQRYSSCVMTGICGARQVAMGSQMLSHSPAETTLAPPETAVS
jgi:hypothetical protein